MRPVKSVCSSGQMPSKLGWVVVNVADIGPRSPRTRPIAALTRGWRDRFVYGPVPSAYERRVRGIRLARHRASDDVEPVTMSSQ
jgi:hypothetical protein